MSRQEWKLSQCSFWCIHIHPVCPDPHPCNLYAQYSSVFTLLFFEVNSLFSHMQYLPPDHQLTGEEVNPQMAEAMLMQSPLATSLLQSFLATSLWLGQQDTPRSHSTPKPQHQVILFSLSISLTLASSRITVSCSYSNYFFCRTKITSLENIFIATPFTVHYIT